MYSYWPTASDQIHYAHKYSYAITFFINVARLQSRLLYGLDLF